MRKKMPVGVEDFEKLITDDYYYVDKTRFIKELLDKLNKLEKERVKYTKAILFFHFV